MDIEQCIDIMRSLEDAYKRIAQSGSVPSDKVFQLKHSVTELTLLMISIKKSMEVIETKLILSKKSKQKKIMKEQGN